MIEASCNPPNRVLEDERVERCFQEGKQDYSHLDLRILKRTSNQCHWGLTKDCSDEDTNMLKIADLIRKEIISPPNLNLLAGKNI